MKKTLMVILTLLIVFSISIPSYAEEQDAVSKHTAQDIIEELAVYYGTYGSEAEQEIENLLEELG